MTQRTERQVLQWTGAASLVLAVAFFALTIAVDELEAVWEPLFILALGLGCQCAMRLLLTTRLNYDHDRLFVTTSGWFQKNRLDKWIIKKDPVRKWADLSTYDPENFTVIPGQRELIIQHTCTSEIMNLLNAVLAFLPLVLLAFADRTLVALAILLVLSLVFSALAVRAVVRARHYRFQVRSGRV